MEFDIPTLLISDTTSTFSLEVGGVTTFQYALPGSAVGCIFDFSAPCVGVVATGLPSNAIRLDATANPNVFTDFFGGMLTFTQLAVPEPASLALFGVGLAGLGMVVRKRRA